MSATDKLTSVLDKAVPPKPAEAPPAERPRPSPSPDQERAAMSSTLVPLATELAPGQEPSFRPDFIRKPFGSLDQKLAAPPRKGYRRHWFNDKPGRIDEALEAGYTFVRDGNDRPKSKVTNAGGQRSYLMEIPEKWYLADVAAGQKEPDRIDAALRRGKVSNAEDDPHTYVPKDGIRIKDVKNPAMAEDEQGE